MSDARMLVCDACGCPVDFESLQLHSDWHDALVDMDMVRAEIKKLANPDRTQR